MKRCPYCNAELQENAEFCLYCMRPLGNKQNITPKKPKSIKLIIIAVISVIAVLLAVIIPISLFLSDNNGDEATDTSKQTEKKEIKQTEKDNESEADDTENEKKNEAETEDSEDEHKKEDDPAYSDFNKEGRSEILAVYEDFKILASITSHQTDCADIFNPNDFLWTHTVTDDDGDVWELYTTDCALDNVVIRVGFCEGDLEIITTICNLTEDNYEEGLKIAEACIYAAYNCSYVELKDALRNETVYQRKEIEYKESLFGEGLLPEPVSSRVDENTEMTVFEAYTQMETTSDTEVHYMVMDQREREYKGKTYYDLAFLHTFEAE